MRSPAAEYVVSFGRTMQTSEPIPIPRVANTAGRSRMADYEFMERYNEEVDATFRAMMDFVRQNHLPILHHVHLRTFERFVAENSDLSRSRHRHQG